MFNQWWFRIYTKSYLSDLWKMIALCVVVDQAMTNFAGDFKFFATFVLAGPVLILFMKTNSGSLRGNIEFHKMSVPFPELKSALIKDIVISVSATLISSLIILLCSILFGGIYSTRIGSAFLYLVSPGMGIFFFAVAFLTGCYMLIINKDRKYLLIDRSTSRITNFINTGGISFFAVLFLGITVSIIPTSHLVAYLMPSTLFIGALLFHQKAIFHQYRSKGRLRDFAKFWSGGIAICCCLYFISLVVSRNDVLNENLHALQRASSYEFNSRYNPEIDIETFKAIERYVSWDVKKDLYADITFDPSTLGLEYYLDAKDPYAQRLVELLRYSKPAPEFLVMLYDHFEKNPNLWKEKKNFPGLQYLAFGKWPKKEKLPERFIVAKQSSHELFKKVTAENQAKAKARRALASQQQEE